jgi:very-short-patch-repair endonuclease
VSEYSIDRRLGNGRLVRVFPAVYAPAPLIEVPLGLETAALLACGPPAALADHSAATLWKMRPGEARPVHVLIRSTRNGPTLDGVVVHRSRTLLTRDIVVHEGLPVTTPARTILEIAVRLDDDHVEQIVANAIHQRLTTLAEFHDVLHRAGRHPGSFTLRRVLARETGLARTESPPQQLLLKMIRDADLPAPETEVYVLGYRLDFLWRKQRLAVEVDAYGTHGSRTSFEKDRRRNARLLSEAGISVLQVTRDRILGEPFAVVALIARALG